ncbi:hypothetical protein [Simkania sp.]|uniref:hypothetical protein n=1 Tax=Simkania sp. TaxID=34094 RepID=UPI003B52A606
MSTKGAIWANMIQANQTAEILGQWSTLSKSQLSTLATSFATQAADLSTRYNLSIIATISMLALSSITFLVTHYSESENVKKYGYKASGGCFLLACAAATLLVDTYLKISNAQLWQQRAIELINTHV